MLNRETAARYYEQASREGTLLENFPLESLSPFLENATPGFDNLVIKGWLRHYEQAEDKEAQRERHQLDHGLAALHMGETRHEAVLIFRPGLEGSTCHMVTVPCEALGAMIARQHAELKERDLPYLEDEKDKSGQPDMVEEMMAATERTKQRVKDFLADRRKTAKLFPDNADDVLIKAVWQRQELDSCRAFSTDIAKALYVEKNGNASDKPELPSPSLN